MPKIFVPKNDTDRTYIYYFYNGKCYKEYNGNRIKLSINPNHFTNSKGRDRLLQLLQYEFTKALNNGWHPLIKEREKPSSKTALELVLEDKLQSNLCDLYKRNLKAVCRMFIDFVSNKHLKDTTDNLPYLPVEDANHLVCEKHWWPQAEAMVGFFNAYQLTNNTEYLIKSLQRLSFTLTTLKDKEHGEWYWGVYPDGTLMKEPQGRLLEMSVPQWKGVFGDSKKSKSST